jgi:hypothetical protein
MGAIDQLRTFTNAPLFYSDSINRLIQLTVIPLSGGHCNYIQYS